MLYIYNRNKGWRSFFFHEWLFFCNIPIMYKHLASLNYFRNFVKPGVSTA